MEFLVICIGILLIALVAIPLSMHEGRHRHQKESNLSTTTINSKIERYNKFLQTLPDPDEVIEYPGSYVMVKESTSQILLNGRVYKFDDIIDFSTTDNQSLVQYHSKSKTTTKTNIGSMLGRAVVGGVLTGGVGAVVGAATAKRTSEAAPNTSQSVTHHNYVINVNVNSLNHPVETLHISGYSETAFNKIVGILNVIVHRQSKFTEDVTTVSAE